MAILDLVENVLRVAVLAESTLLLYYSIKAMKEEYKRLARFNSFDGGFKFTFPKTDGTDVKI